MPDPALEKPVVEVTEEPAVAPETQEVETAPVAAPKLSAEDQLAAKIREDFERLYGSRMKELQDGFRSIQRLNTKLQQELETVKRAVPTPVATPAAPGADRWGTIQDGQVWKAEIEKLAEEKAKGLLAQQEAFRVQQDELLRQEQIRTQWTQEVMVRYPDLGPDGDAKSQISTVFNDILNEHPEYLRNPFGPKLAMVDMKEKLQAMGVADPDTKLNSTLGANQELARRSRVAVASGGPSRTTVPTSTKVTLTKDEMEFCKYQGINPVVYAKNKQMLETTGTLEAA